MENLFQMMEIDEQLMKILPKKTDGKYFRTASNNKLAEIYASINKLETTEIEEELKFYDYDEKLDRLYGLLDFFSMLEVALRNTKFIIMTVSHSFSKP
jgi:Ca-activated chloride channel family protein